MWNFVIYTGYRALLRVAKSRSRTSRYIGEMERQEVRTQFCREILKEVTNYKTYK
jgi:hypothetical protein